MSSAVVTLDQRGTSGRFTEELVIYALQVCDVRPKKTAREWEKARAHDEPVIEGAYKFRLMRGPTCIVEVLMPHRSDAEWGPPLSGPPLKVSASFPLEWTTEPPTDVRVTVNPLRFGWEP